MCIMKANVYDIKLSCEEVGYMTDNAETTTETTAETVENSTETNKVKTSTGKTEAVVTTADNISKDTGTKRVQTTAANEWSYIEAVMTAPTAGTITLDDVIRLHNEKGEDLAPSDFDPYLYRTFVSNNSDIMKFRVINGVTYMVSKENVVYLTLMPGYGRPLISAFLHNADLSLKTEILNPVDGNGGQVTEFDLVMEINYEKPWFMN